MSEEEIINNLSSSENIENEEIAVEEKKNSDENNSANNVYDSGKKQKTKKYHAPLYIAACILPISNAKCNLKILPDAPFSTTSDASTANILYFARQSGIVY